MAQASQDSKESEPVTSDSEQRPSLNCIRKRKSSKQKKNKGKNKKKGKKKRGNTDDTIDLRVDTKESKETEDEKKDSDNDDKNDNGFPEKLTMVAVEEDRILNLDDVSKRIESKLKEKYNKDISKLAFFPKHTMLRFVINFRYSKDEKERTELTLDAFSKYMEFHRKYQFDTILKNGSYRDLTIMNCKYNEDMWMNAEETYIYGIDKQGHPIVWFDNVKFEETFNMFSLKDGSRNVDYNVLCFYRSIFFRRVFVIQKKLSKYYNRDIFYFTQIMNVKNVSTLDLFNQARKNGSFFKEYEKHCALLFPETLHQLILINVPLAIKIVANVLSQYLHESTMSKLIVYSSDFIKEIDKHVDINMIPKKYGGKGKWDVRLLNVPKDFPFQCDDDGSDDDDNNDNSKLDHENENKSDSDNDNDEDKKENGMENTK